MGLAEKGCTLVEGECPNPSTPRHFPCVPISSPEWEVRRNRADRVKRLEERLRLGMGFICASVLARGGRVLELVARGS